MAEPYIKLFKKMLDWEWYDDPNTCRVFIHCLLKANWKPCKWHGEEIEPGQFITSLQTLAEETHLSIKQVRVALEHLKNTGEVASKGQSKYRIITVNNWCQYQQEGKQAASKGQTKGKQGATDKEYKEEKNNKEDIYLYTNNSNVSNFLHALDNLNEEYTTYIKNNKELFESVNAWLQYKDERKPKISNHYEETGLKTLLNKIYRSCKQYGDADVMKIIDLSMSNNYAGIVWDRLGNQRKGERDSDGTGTRNRELEKQREEEIREYLKSDEYRRADEEKPFG